ncbi:MAG TPA: L-threonylcarbamoyladenylate synthase [Bryobacteraceae bacterium]|nr:L-threonylcarbamoyladenylate synthase [Bryobacteraceae bacterium]
MVSESEIARAAEVIRAGGLVAFPTETVYGLGANALNTTAVERIYEAKGRPPASPLIVHVAGVELARQLATKWSAVAERLVRRFWPGPLTLVLGRHPRIPDRVTAGLPTVGLRMPAHPVALALIRAAGVPIAAPSANRFTALSPTTAEHVRAALGGSVDMVLDDGPTNVGIESTVLSIADPSHPLLLRPGMVTQADIEAVIGPVQLQAVPLGAHPSPGMHARHYSPRTPLLLIRRGDALPAGRGTIAQLPSDPREYAARLYAVLHDLDREGLDYIAIEAPPDTPEWAGILDRLRRAAKK